MVTTMNVLRKRFLTNIKNPVLRYNVTVRMVGKLIGVGIVMLLISAIVPAFFAHAAGLKDDPSPEINAINTSWTLIAAFLVFCMQVGFEMLEAGFARQREAINILVEGIADTCICGVLFWAFGFAFMFMPGTPWIGTSGFFLMGIPATYGATGVPVLAFWVFQFAFADTCSTITSGAMVGRTGFIGDLLYSVGVTGFIYPIIGHWAWGPDGWLNVMGFRDFAGSTVVHTIGGVISLAGALVLGPRLGRVFKRDGGGPWPAHDIILGALGGLILWFGWYGFNPGSTLSAMDVQGIGRVSFNTTLAACSGGLLCLFVSYFRTKTWDLGLTVNGFLGGLVAITCPCYWVDPVGAFFIGILGAVAVIVGTDVLEYARIDDPIGAVPVHMFGGIVGTLSLGLFASGQFGYPTPLGVDNSTVLTGLFYGGGISLFTTQLIGSAAVTVGTLIVAMALMYAVKATGTLRVTAAGEIQGLDIHEHGTMAYPEFTLHGNDGTPKSLEEVKAAVRASKGLSASIGD